MFAYGGGNTGLQSTSGWGGQPAWGVVLSSYHVSLGTGLKSAGLVASAFIHSHPGAPGWPWTCCNLPASTPECWNYRSLPLFPALLDLLVRPKVLGRTTGAAFSLGRATMLCCSEAGPLFSLLNLVDLLIAIRAVQLGRKDVANGLQITIFTWLTFSLYFLICSKQIIPLPPKFLWR